MAKEIKGKLKLQIPGGGATPAPPVGSALGQQGVNIMEFCKQFNAKTADRKGQTVPVVITVYKDRSFDFILKTAPTSELLRKKLGIKKGSSRPQEEKVGTLTWDDLTEIANIKLPDLNTIDVEQAKKIVAGTALRMGIEIVD
ncbi:50S ribosomal protein L11 [bacterium]|jgi:large subunit ribosomal protein L11|nr:50S ribosomal protein L11 [bacterium]MBT3903481.1 50S ribosomal protein L11 [bacterium]MBT4577539.1 50S ribosomal protein L11 [bacterium]MBT5345827.1 50S ribosomal protein L11 [bacterium]MBT6131285.1 50S ribosomal protein L11 [bacterium]